MRRPRRRIGVLIVVAAIAVVSMSALPTAPAEGTPRVEYTVEPAAYNNSVRVGSVSDVLYPRVAAGPSVSDGTKENVYVLGLSSSSCSQLVTIRSTDGGQTFEAPRSTTGLCLGGLFADALVSPDGSVYVAIHGPSVLRSQDDGVTWNVIASIPDEAWYVALALDAGTGTLHLVWLNPRDYLPYAPPIFRTASSHDGGSTWTPPVDVLPDATGVTAPQIAAANGKVAIGYVRQDAEGQYVAVVASSDDGLARRGARAHVVRGHPGPAERDGRRVGRLGERDGDVRVPLLGRRWHVVRVGPRRRPPGMGRLRDRGRGGLRHGGSAPCRLALDWRQLDDIPRVRRDVGPKPGAVQHERVPNARPGRRRELDAAGEPRRGAVGPRPPRVGRLRHAGPARDRRDLRPHGDGGRRGLDRLRRADDPRITRAPGSRVERTGRAVRVARLPDRRDGAAAGDV